MDELEADLWVLVRQSDAHAHGGWAVRDEADCVSALRHYVQNMLAERCATVVQAWPGSSALSLRRDRAEFVCRLQRLKDLHACDLAVAIGEVARHCDHGTADVAEVPGRASAGRVLERVEQQLARSRPSQRVSKLRDGLVVLAELLRERPGEHARFFDGRGMTVRLPEIEALVGEFAGAVDDLWLVPVRRI